MKIHDGGKGNAFEPVIEIGDLRKAYQAADGEVLAVNGVSLDIRRGEFISLLGPSGCGKTTLLRMIAGLESPTSGLLSINGSVIDGPPDGIGIVFQVPALMAWRNALHNVILPAELQGRPRNETEARARSLLELVGLRDFAGKYPHELSGGMQQRVAIARALVNEPEILLFDEPFSALDAMTRNQLNVELLRILESQRRTSVLITHSISEAVFLSNRIVVLSGRPASVQEIVEIDLPAVRGPELRVSPEFNRYVDHIGRIVGLEYA